MKEESKSKYPKQPIFSLTQRVARHIVRQWSEELDKFLTGSITERDNFIINKMLKEQIPGLFFGIIQGEVIERFKVIQQCNKFHEILQEELNLYNAPKLKWEYVNDAIDMGKTLMPFMPKEEDEHFLTIINDATLLSIACSLGYLDLIKVAYEKARNEDANFTLVGQFDETDISEFFISAWLGRHWDVVDWLLERIKTETENEDIHFSSISETILGIVSEKRYDEFTYLWDEFSNTEKRRFVQVLLDNLSDNMTTFVRKLALIDRKTFDEFLKLSAQENENQASQELIFSLFINVENPEMLDIIYEHANEATKERMKNKLMKIEKEFSSNACILSHYESEDFLYHVISKFLDDLPSEKKEKIGRYHLLSALIDTGNISQILKVWHAFDQEEQKRLIVGVFSFMLQNRALAKVDAKALKDVIDIFNHQIQEFHLQEDLENHLHSPGFLARQVGSQAYLIWLLNYDSNNSEACRIINDIFRDFFPRILNYLFHLHLSIDLDLRLELLLDNRDRCILFSSMIFNRLHQCYDRIFKNDADNMEKMFVLIANKVLEKNMMKVICLDNQPNDHLFNLVFHVLNNISNPRLEGSVRDLEFSKAHELLRLLDELMLSGETDPVALQCQLVSSILQNREKNCLLKNAELGRNRLVSKFKSQLVNPFDEQPSRSITEDFAILLYESLKEKYSTELQYHFYFPTAAIKVVTLQKKKPSFRK